MFIGDIPASGFYWPVTLRIPAQASKELLNKPGIIGLFRLMIAPSQVNRRGAHKRKFDVRVRRTKMLRKLVHIFRSSALEQSPQLTRTSACSSRFWLAPVSNEGKEIRCKAAAEVRVDLRQKRLTLRNFVIDATKSLESDRRQYLRKQIQIWATINDTEERSDLSFDRCVDGKFILMFGAFTILLFDKQNMRGKIRGSHDEFLAEVFGNLWCGRDAPLRSRGCG